jgi:flagellar basal body-associated protein FliL
VAYQDRPSRHRVEASGHRYDFGCPEPWVRLDSALGSLAAEHAMIAKRQKLVLWICFALLVLLSAAGVWFSFVMRKIIPIALNDSSPNFSQLPDTDRWSVYHQAQSLMLSAGFVMLALAILWAALAGFMIWKLSKKAEHELHEAANHSPEPSAVVAGSSAAPSIPRVGGG